MPPTYRYEMALSGRAGCQNSACKHDGLKIAKGELRFGVLCTFEDRDFWKWKHWGCVTPIQLSNVQKDIEGLDIDDEEDMTVLDGYEELPDEAKEKIKQALKDGHVADEDWKGDPEKNRPGQKGINSARRKKKILDNENADENRPTDDSPVKLKKKRITKKEREAAAATDEDAEDELAEREDTPVLVKKKRGKKVKDEDPEDSAEEVMPAKRKRAAPRKRKAEADEVGIKSDDELLVPEPPKKKGRAKKEMVKKEEETDEVDKMEEDAVTEAPLKRGRAKKVKKEEEDAGEEMLDLANRTVVRREEAGMVKKEEQMEDMSMADLPEAKSARTSRVRKVKSEPEAEDNGEEVPQSKPARKPRAKKVKQEVKEEPVDNEQNNEPADRPDALKLEEPLVKMESDDGLAGPTRNDESEPAQEVIEAPRVKKGRKPAKRAR